MNSPFERFMGQEVKTIFKDIDQNRIARGILADIQNGFITIDGRLGTIVIKESNVEKMALSAGGSNE